MGVHTTFVRSVDLDEWTQRQIDAMRLGGNANARKYFREHGLTDMHGKIEKKYTSKAARAYKAELEKQVEAAAAQRGEATASAATTGSLLENLSLQDQQEAAAARAAAAKAGASQPVGTAVPTAKLASQLDGAKGRLVVTPPTSGNLAGGLPKTATTGTGGTLSGGLLRKPAGKATNSKMLLKKPSGGASGMKLRVNKLPVGGANASSMTTNGSSAATATKTDDDGGLGGFDDDVEEEPAPVPAVAAPAVVEPTPAPAPSPPKEPEKKPQSAMQNNVSRLQAMNSDFFSGL
jgi:ADP-ribosylation factor GTPase-activating protein 2/3